MKITGITRRIDELGRVVIPKEIRKNMRLKTGELLEIYLNDSETITLKKHSLINKNEEFLNFFIKNLSKTIGCDLYVTNLSEIIFSSNSTAIGDKISSNLDEIMGNNISLSSLNELKLTDKIILEDNFIVLPILPNGDFSGIFVADNINSEKSNNLLKFGINFIESYLESN